METLKTLKSKGVNSIGFKHLTFGDAPFRVEAMHVGPRVPHQVRSSS